MPDPIRGTINSGPIPMRSIDIQNNGATGEVDHDLTDDPACGTGTMTVARFPEKAPDINKQKELAALRAKSSPNGDDATAQTYRAEVPFTGTTLSLGAGSSEGGAGAALTTGGNVFVGAAGKLGMQSVGAFTGQTNDAMGLFSTGGTFAHSQNKFEIYAGGGTGPGACGSGGPAGTTPGDPPATSAETLVNRVSNVLGVVKAANDMRNLVGNWKGGIADFATGAKALTDAANKGYALYADLSGADAEAAKKKGKVADGISGTLNVIGGLAKVKDDPIGALSSIVSGASSISGAAGGTSVLNPDRPVSGASGAAGLVPGAPASGGGGAGGSLNIEERAAARIHSCCNVKIYANAPEGIDWKVAGAYVVNAVSAVDFATTNWGAFAAALFKVRALVTVDVKCRKFEMKAWGTGKLTTPHTTITASSLSTLDGNTTVFSTFTGKRQAYLYETLTVGGNTQVGGSLIVEKKVTTKNNVTVYGKSTVKGGVKVKGSYVGKARMKALSEGKLG